jgi:tetratricopeptide (TPR) repeat protein
VGRENDLEHLHQRLQRNHEVVIAAVEGMGGVGKTELAIQYSLLHLQLKNYPGGICWLRARESNIGLQIVNFACTDLDLQPPDDLDLPEGVRWCWSHWLEGNTLIVLDDVKNYSDIKPYLPPQPSQFKVLITTRLKLNLSNSMYLEVLQEADALKLLTQLVGEEKINQELEKAKELCQRLGNLPLALQLVGHYVFKRKISLAQMLQRLENKGLGHPSLVVTENDPTWTLNMKRGVAAAFELSWEELSESAQELGCFLSLFALAPIPWSLVESTAVEQDSEKLEDARIELENLHLIGGGDTYQLHQLIYEFFRNKQQNLAGGCADAKKRIAAAMVVIAKEIPYFKDLTREHIESLKDRTPHLAEVGENLTGAINDEDLIRVFTGLYNFYCGQKLHVLAETWCKQGLSAIKERLGEEHPDVALSLSNLASIYDDQGRYAEAEALYHQALELYKRLRVEEHPDVAETLDNLALVYKSQGRYAEAEPLYQQALSMRKRLLGQEHPSVAKSLNNLANLYRLQRRYGEAEPLFQQALSMRKRLLGQEHPSVAKSLTNLANVYRLQGRYAEAEPIYQQALSMRKRLLGQEHTSVANTLNNLALLYCDQGRYGEAEPLLQQALSMRKRLLSQEHPHVAKSLNDLALFYCDQGRYGEAEPLIQQALSMRKRLFGQEHPYVAKSLNDLGELYKSQGNYTEAEPLFQQALEIDKRLLGEDHPHTITVRNNLESLRERDR